MQEFTVSLKNLTKGLKPVNVFRGSGFLLDCLNLQPTAGGKLEHIDYLQFPPVFITEVGTSILLAKEDFFFVFQNKTLDGNVLDNDASWSALPLSIVSVNGLQSNVGVTLTLDEKGSTGTIQADGSLHFVPGPTYKMGEDESNTITLTYEVTDGISIAECTVKITVWGVAGASGDYLLLIAPKPNDTEIIDQTGKKIEVHGNVSVEDGLILMKGGHFYVGNSGDFDFLLNGEQDWTLEFLIDITHYDTPICTCRNLENVFILETWFVEKPFYLSIYSHPYTVIGLGDIDDFPLEPGMNHVAFVFDAQAIENGVRMFIQGEYIGTFDHLEGTYFTHAEDCSLFFGQKYPERSLGAFKGIRIAASILYPGVASFTPPEEF